VIIIWAAWAGAVCASYGGVVRERGWRASASGRSVCVCGRQLTWHENIPVVGYLAAHGRARCCASVLPRRYVVTETVAMVVGAAAGLLLGAAGVGVAVVAGLGIALLARASH
jgi:prepilin signal peptidase PulO-like enzyme (type II secretory pathway)